MSSQGKQGATAVPYAALIPSRSGQTVDTLRNMVGAARYKEQQQLAHRRELEKELDELKALRVLMQEERDQLQEERDALAASNASLKGKAPAEDEEEVQELGEKSNPKKKTRIEWDPASAMQLLSLKKPPSQSKFYALPAIMDRPNLTDLRKWIEDLEIYVANVPDCKEVNGLYAFLRGRMTGHIRATTDKAVRELQEEGSFEDELPTFKKIWKTSFGLLDDDDLARKKLENLTFFAGSISEHVLKVDALYADMKEAPMHDKDKVRNFLKTIKDEKLQDLLKYDPNTQCPWEGEKMWMRLTNFIQKRFGVDHVGTPKRKQDASGGGSGGEGGGKKAKPNPQGTPGSDSSDGKRGKGGKGKGKWKKGPGGKSAEKDQGKKTFIKLSDAAVKWCLANKKCLKCGRESSKDHIKKTCKNPWALPKDMPENLKQESLKERTES